MSKWVSILLLLLFALIGNHFHLDLFFGVAVIFGSIAVLMSVRLHGIAIGTLVALLSGVYTYYLWGHPYAMMIFTAEALSVGILLRYGVKSLIIADTVYWLLLGTPLVWLFYSQVMGMANDLALLILLKQPINAITNAIAATFLLLLLPWSLREKISTQTQHHIGITELVFSLLIATSFISSLLILLHENRSALRNLEANVEYRLQTSSANIERYLNESDIGVGSEQLNSKLNEFVSIDGSQKYIVLDKFNQLLVSNIELEKTNQFLTSGSEKQITGSLSQWLPPRNDQPFMVWWKQTYYYISTTLHRDDIGRLVLLKSSASLVSEIRNKQIESLSLLLLITLSGIVFAYVVSKWMNKAVIALSVQTRNISSRLRSNESLVWPRSYIKEFDDLSLHAEAMSSEMAMLIDKLVGEQELLESRVKISNDTLKESFARSSAIIETAVEGIVTMDEYGLIESFNPAAEKMFARSEEETIGFNFVDLLKADDNNILLEQIISASIESDCERLLEIDAKRKSGEIFSVEIAVSEVLLKDHKIYTAFINDISGRKQAERLKNEFVSNVSHELRTPLTSIRGAIGLMASDKLGEMPEKFKSMLNITLENSERLVRLINDILDIQKLEAGGLVFVLRPEKLAPIVQQCVEQNIAYGEQFGVRLKLINSVEDVLIKTEPDRLNQVLTNLISNAVKFSPLGEDVTIMVSSLGNNVRISVTDKGPGIPESYHASIFDKFSQLDASASRSKGGTGLGLNIAKSYITRMHGEIGFDSVEGRGTSFYILIPIYQP